MQTYFDQISDVLQVHGHCLLPGIGLLQKVSHPASQNFQENNLYPPFSNIELDNSKKSGDQSFSIEDQIMLTHQIPKEEAKKAWEKTLFQIKEKLATGSSIALGSIGWLNLDEEGQISFVSEQDVLSIYNPVPIPSHKLSFKKPATAQETNAPDYNEAAAQQNSPSDTLSKLKEDPDPYASQKLKNRAIWWISGSILALLVVGWFIYKGTEKRKGEKNAIQDVIDSVAIKKSTPIIDSLKRASDSMDLERMKANDSIHYRIVFAIYHQKRKAEHQYKRMKGWGHPVVLVKKDSSLYELAMPFTSLPKDTTVNLVQMMKTYGGKAHIEYTTGN